MHNLWEQYPNFKCIPENELVISETDLKGKITYVNDAFAEICEFDKDLMIGFKHNVIRHSDMPAWVFKDMWDTIKKDEEWRGIIKNQTFNGRNCYWVAAKISPIFEDGVKVGYESIRRQATNLEIQTAAKNYGISID